MKKYDFVFVYEVKNRELESICLISNELIRRGYTVKLINTWSEVQHRHKLADAEVTVGFAMYNDGVLGFVASFVNHCSKFVNLQWEQLRSEATLELEDGSLNIVGISTKAHHISHGEKNWQWLLEHCKISPDKAHLCGNVALDFCRRELYGFYKGKSELYEKYGIPTDKKICMFISSFTAQNLPDLISESELSVNSGWDFREELNNEKDSQKAILEWIDAFLCEDNSSFFIYRPHPAEDVTDAVKDLEKKHTEFRIIRDEPVKQWIIYVDKILLWASTTIIDVYASGKSCGILRPVNIYEFMKYDIYNDARIIGNYKEFTKEIREELPFPINSDQLKPYINIDNIPTYIKICDVLEKVHKSNEKMEVVTKNGMFKSVIGCNFYNIGKVFKDLILENRILIKIISNLLILDRIKEKYLKHVDNHRYSRIMYMSNRYDQNEIDNIMYRISKALEN